MDTVYKYELELTERQVLSLPADARILDIQVQNESLCAWVKLDTEKPERERVILIVGTGNRAPHNAQKHISTVQMNGFVWHFFEV